MHKNILDYYAQNRVAYLHGGGRDASMHLFHQLDIKGNKTILEIGFGIGASLFSLKGMYPNINLYGAEQNEEMYQMAKNRLKGSHVDLNKLHLLKTGDSLPFVPQSFDIIYLESVLGILSLDAIRALLKEIHVLLKRDGRLGLNDTLWLTEIPMSERKRINQNCIKNWGIPQANEHLSNQEDWKKELKKAGLLLDYFAEWDAKHINQKPNRHEYLAQIKDKFIYTINHFKKSHQEKKEALNTLPKELLIEDKAYLNSYIMVAKKV